MHSNLKKMVYRRCINLCALTILAFYPQLADAQRSFIDYRTAVSKDSALVVEHKSKSKVLSTKKQTSENIQPDDRIIDPDDPRIPQPFKSDVERMCHRQICSKRLAGKGNLLLFI